MTEDGEREIFREMFGWLDERWSKRKSEEYERERV